MVRKNFKQTDQENKSKPAVKSESVAGLSLAELSLPLLL